MILFLPFRYYLFQEFLEKIMKQFTGELNNKNETIIQTNEVKIERVYPEVEENKEGE